MSDRRVRPSVSGEISSTQLPHVVHSDIDPRVVLAMAATCAFAVANIYFNQPLLPDLARAFGVPESAAGVVPTATQAGYALGLVLIAPLGDCVERRKLILILIACLAVGLLGAGVAPSLLALAGISFGVGIVATVAQQVVPMAAHLANPKRRGHVVGTVMAGLLIGILGARTFAGIVGDTLGWRAVFVIAAGLMIGVGILVRVVFPISPPTVTLPYLRLIRSPWRILIEERLIREVSCVGALLFGAFSVFWSTLALYLDSPAYHLGATAAGLFGLIGIAGAAAAPLAGKAADRGGARRAVGIGILCTILSFVVMGVFGEHLWGLVVGVVLLDLGVQTAQISNQSRIYTVRPEARSRITTVYMGLYFVGGAVGSAAGSIAWSLAGWTGVSIVGLALATIALVVHTVARK
jgi:predicted MFS family arabinose efflux permease